MQNEFIKKLFEGNLKVWLKAVKRAKEGQIKF